MLCACARAGYGSVPRRRGEASGKNQQVRERGFRSTPGGRREQQDRNVEALLRQRADEI